MDFGKLENIEGVDFAFPIEPKGNKEALSAYSGKPKLYVGCPVWADKRMLNHVYPKGTKQKDFLLEYGKRFNSIELNAAFYNIPSPKTIRSWYESVPKDFKFAPKVLNTISHIKQLKDVDDVLNVYLEHMLMLEDKLGMMFLQMSDRFGPKQFERLEQFLSKFPKDADLAIELRHKEWFSEASSELFELLQETNTSTVITDTAGRRDVLHLRLTNDKVVIRFCGNNLHPTDYQRLDDWVKKTKEWVDLGLQEMWFFMHTPNKGLTGKLARYFITELNKVVDADIKPPQLPDDEEQGSLF